MASGYARHRPHYPEALFAWIASVAPATGDAWDVACGSGQATRSLAMHFDRVIGTDASAEQLAQAPTIPNVTWRVAPAESSGLEGGSVDAVTIAQALHWLDRDRFWAEVGRVARPDAVVAAFSYGMQSTGSSRLDALLREYHDRIVGPWWPPERRLVGAGHLGLSFPFAPVAPPPFEMVTEWTAEDELGYLRSWSATQRALDATGEDPIAAVRDRLVAAWGKGPRRVAWPLTVLAGRVAPTA